jgi:lysophospholipase L1-like esterase
MLRNLKSHNYGMTIYTIFLSTLLVISVSCYGAPVDVVFMGDSITEWWENEDPSFFANKPYVNRGISGQTTGEMLERFERDVIESKPTTVVILAGTNDIAEMNGPITNQEIMKNIAAMAEMAHEHKIRVVLCSVLPAHRLRAPGKIIKLNSMIKSYAEKNKHAYVDYYSAMVDDNKRLKSDYTEDGLHPNVAGYKVMAPLVEKAISESRR